TRRHSVQVSVCAAESSSSGAWCLSGQASRAKTCGLSDTVHLLCRLAACRALLVRCPYRAGCFTAENGAYGAPVNPARARPARAGSWRRGRCCPACSKSRGPFRGVLRRARQVRPDELPGQEGGRVCPVTRGDAGCTRRACRIVVACCLEAVADEEGVLDDVSEGAHALAHAVRLLDPSTCHIARCGDTPA